jgi:hypothetical protein
MSALPEGSAGGAGGRCRQNGRVLTPRLVVLVVLVLAASACGGSKNAGNGGGSASGGGHGGLVANVSDAKVAVQGPNEVASAKVAIGGVPGKHLTLEWGLVDALEGNQSQEERLVRHYVTTKNVVTHMESVKIPLSQAVSPLLVHFVLYAPDGSYLASDDTPDFGKGT